LETVTKQLYEGMFLVDVAKASSDWDGVISSLTKILEKAEAEIISIRKWDDRKLAYNIKSQSRGVYIICYFKVDGTKIQEIEKNIRLSEQVMRLLILNAEEMTQEDIEKDTPAMKTEKEGIKPEEEISEVIAEREDLEPAWNADESNSEIEEETEVADESELESETEEQA
jgi:small subunit ribosomal protein S6